MRIYLRGTNGLSVEPTDCIVVDGGKAVEAMFQLPESFYTDLIVDGRSIVGFQSGFRSGKVVLRFAPRMALLAEE